MNEKGIPLVLMLLLTAPGQAQTPLKSDPFYESVLKRASVVKVVDLSYKLKEIRVKNSPTPMAELLQGIGKAKTTLANDLILESTNRIVIQDRMTRWESAHPIWHLGKGKPLPEQRLSVTNRKSASMFYPIGRGTDTQVSGTVKKALDNHAMRLYYMLPIGFTFRGLDRNFVPYTVQSFKPSFVRQRIQGAECMEYAGQMGKDSRTSLLVDPGKDHNIIRYIHARQGKVQMQIDITYARNQVCGWTPESWVEHFYTPKGKLERRTEVKVVSCKFNESLPEDQFTIVFPAGTRVSFIDEGRYYRVKEDGGLRLLSQSGEDLPAAEMQEGRGYGPILLWTVGCSGVIALVIILIRRRTKRNVSA